MRLILASASPRRAELLRAAGYDFDVVPADVDESICNGEAAAMYVRRLAAEKSAAVMARIAGNQPGLKPCPTTQPDPVVLGADTVVVADEQILGKPSDAADAERMLRLLSGRAHSVLTGVSLRRGACELGRVVSTGVEFAPLSSGDISWYLASGEGFDKAGAYAIQGLASRFVTSIDGSYSNVVGLPIAVVHALFSDIASGPASGYSEKQISPRKSL
jgi:septum formation protein